MLSSSGSRERQPGGILSLSLSLSLPLSLPPPSFSSFLSLHAQARIHTRALRHTAAEGRGHTVKASPLPPDPSCERQPVSLSSAILWFPSRTTAPRKRLEKDLRQRDGSTDHSHTYILFFSLCISCCQAVLAERQDVRSSMCAYDKVLFSG